VVVACPGAGPPCPLQLMVATLVADELHTTEPVRFCVRGIGIGAVAVTAECFPGQSRDSRAFTAIDPMYALERERLSTPLRCRRLPWIVVVRWARLVAIPALMVAHSYWKNSRRESCQILSGAIAIIPVRDGWVLPRRIAGFAGVTAIDTNVGAVT